jgi:hypothetical protein
VQSVASGSKQPIAEAIALLAEDAERVALIELTSLEAEENVLLLRSVFTGYSEAAEAALREVAEAVRKEYGIVVSRVEVAEPEYW